MKKQLKKKTKIQDIVFPNTLLHSNINQQKQPSSILSVQRKPSPNKHRTLSKGNHDVNKSSKLNRSVSLDKKISNRGVKPNDQRKMYNGWEKERFIRSRSRLNKRTNSNSAADIASIFYKGMEKNLVRECQQVLRTQKPNRSQSSYQLQALNNQMLLVRKNNKGEVLKKNTMKEQIAEQPLPQDFFEPISMVRVETASQQSETDNKEASQRQGQLQDVQFSDEPLTSIKRIEDSLLKKKSDIIDKRPILASHKSLINSQTRFQKMCNSLINTKAYMVSSKMLAKSVGLFSINKVEYNSKTHSQLSLLFEIAGQVVFKKIQSLQKRPAQIRLRKHHMRIQHMRQKSRDRIFNHFNKKVASNSLVSLYEDILSYIQQHTIVDRSYRGLILMDQDETNLIISNQDRILEILNINTCFYFILRLGSTFYLVKATNNELKGIHFIFLCDFTTLSTGDQLVFPHFSHFPQTKPKKFKTAMSKAVLQFKQAAEDQWSRGAQNTEISAKIGKITIQTLQRDSENLDLWNINKKYQMVGDITNFFELHDHFDYGFFKKQPNCFRAGPLFYTLTKRKPILFYHFPFNYKLIEANQMQKEALFIAHMPTHANTFKQRAVSSFYKRLNNHNRNKSVVKLIMYLKNNRITVQVAQCLDILIESSKTLKGHRLRISKQKILDRTNLLSINEAVENAFQLYSLEQSFLYKRYQLVKKPEIIIYYKALHKFQGHFGFVSLYRLTRVNLIEFKIYTFHLGRSFIVHLDIDHVFADNVKETITNLINIFKNTYFRKVLQLEMRKSQKRKKDALQDFFRNQVKFNPNNIRMKRKNEDQLRKKNLMRVVSLRNSAESYPIEEVLISRLSRTYDGRDCFFSLRLLSEKELKESKGDMNEKIVVCLYFGHRMTHFRYLCTLKELTSISVPQWSANQQLDPRQLLCVLQQITQDIMGIIKQTDSSFKFLFSRLKHFFNPNRTMKTLPVHPYIYRLIGRNILETKDLVGKPIKSPLSTKLSIDLNIQKQYSLQTSYVLQNCESSSALLKIASPSVDELQKKSKDLQIVYMVDVAPDWLIEVVDFYDQASRNRSQGLIERDRRVRLVDRQTEQCLMLGQWSADFLSNIRYASYNKRMLKRLLRGVRSAL